MGLGSIVLTTLMPFGMTYARILAPTADKKVAGGLTGILNQMNFGPLFGIATDLSSCMLIYYGVERYTQDQNLPAAALAGTSVIFRLAISIISDISITYQEERRRSGLQSLASYPSQRDPHNI